MEDAAVSDLATEGEPFEPASARRFARFLLLLGIVVLLVLGAGLGTIAFESWKKAGAMGTLVPVPPGGSSAAEAVMLGANETLYVAYADGEIRYLSVGTYQEGYLMTGGSHVVFDRERCCALSNDVHGLARWKLASPGFGERTTAFEPTNNEATAIALSEDGRVAVSGADDKNVRVWDVASGKLVKKLRGHSGPIRSVAVSRDGKKALSVASDHEVRSWDLVSFASQEEPAAGESTVLWLAFFPDGERKLALTGTSVRAWSGRTALWERPLSGISAALSPDGSLVGVGTRAETVVLLSTDTGEPVQEAPTGAGLARCVAFSQDGLWCLAGTQSGAVVTMAVQERRP